LQRINALVSGGEHAMSKGGDRTRRKIPRIFFVWTGCPHRPGELDFSAAFGKKGKVVEAAG
jgi:hypothetical protein